MTATSSSAVKATASALFLSFHCRKADGGAGGFVARNFESIVRRTCGGEVLGIFQDDPPGRREIAALAVEVKRRSTAMMVWRLFTSHQVGRFKFRFSRAAHTTAPSAVDLFVDGVGFGPVLGHIPSGCFRRSVVLHHNFEPDYYADMYHGKPGVSWWTRVGIVAQEAAMRHASLNLFLTRQDMEKAEIAFGRSRGTSAVFGAFEPVTPLPQRLTVRSGPLRVLVTGTLSDRKGYLGLIEFLGVASTRRSELEVQLVFIVAGRNPTAELSALADGRFISLLPNPPSIADVAVPCDVYLNPNFTGSGIKMRNFDGLRHGLPVLCRRENAAGFDHLSAPVFQTFDTVNEGLEKLMALPVVGVRSERVRQLVWTAYSAAFGLDHGVFRLANLLAA